MEGLARNRKSIIHYFVLGRLKVVLSENVYERCEIGGVNRPGFAGGPNS